MSAARIGIFSRGILRIPHLELLLDARVARLGLGRARAVVDAVGGWGYRSTSVRAREYAERHRLPYLALEDGFLRSVRSGREDPPLSIVVDDVGVYYQAAAPSRLELQIATPLDAPAQQRALALREAWCRERVSKYNAARDPGSELPERFVLLIDQTRGDASVVGALADAQSFERMLDAALDENPGVQVLIKVHPEVLAGRVRGYFDAGRAAVRDPRVIVCGTSAHLAAMLERAVAVYTVSSQAGFEALLWGRPVRTFGMPFYAGWGLTRDELPAPARRQAVSLEQLTHAALIDYPRYVDPVRGVRCAPEELIEHIGLQRRMRQRFAARLNASGFSPWKRPLVRDFLAGSEVRFVAAGRSDVEGTQVVWGTSAASPRAAPVLRLEDGFLRSIGLGADLVRPLSWLVDASGLHFDAAQRSDLETLLQERQFDAALLARACRLRERIVAAGLSKYNLSGRGWQRPAGRARVVLVVGQVETDAAVHRGGGGIRGNAELIERVRAASPDAWLVYKPHPDVVAGLRRRGERELAAGALCDEVLVDVSMEFMLREVDEVHVLSSLAGFEALLRGRTVVCHGQPFYAGWGLTRDLAPIVRRSRRLTLDELVAGSLILYPTYVHPELRCFMSAEQAVESLASSSRADAPSLPRRLLRSVLRLNATIRGR